MPLLPWNGVSVYGYHTHNCFQDTNRALVEQYFDKELAAMIWDDYRSANGDLGALDYNPLYASQDPQITDFKIIAAAKKNILRIQ